MKKHPDDGELLAFVAREDSPEARAIVSEHVERECGPCLEKVRTYEAILARFEVPPLEEVPDQWIEEAIRQIRELEEQPTSMSDRLRSSVGSVISKASSALEEIRFRVLFDSAVSPTPIGVRGTAGFKGRQLLLDSEFGRVHLEISRPSAERSEIRGQFLPAESSEAGTGKAILEHDGRSTKRRISRTGDFQFVTPATGAITLSIEWKGKLLATDPVDLSTI